MNTLFENSGLATLVMVLLGWYVHNLFLCSKLSKIRKRNTNLIWYIQNRPNAFKSSFVCSICFGIGLYVYMYPPAMDITTEEGRHDFGLFLLYAFLEGVASELLVDFAATKFNVRGSNKLIDDEPDDGATRVPKPGEVQKILEECESKGENK